VDTDLEFFVNDTSQRLTDTLKLLYRSIPHGNGNYSSIYFYIMKL